MLKHSILALSLGAALTVGCGGNPPDAARDGGGGKSGAADANPNGGPTPAERTGSMAAGAPTLTADDQTFVEKAASGGQMEVALGNLAGDKARGDAVKKLGERIADDHERANRDLAASVRGSDAMPSDHLMPTTKP